MMLFIKLFLNFFKVGLFAVGGGMATVPFLYELSDTTGWYSYNDLANMIAVGESTPGPIGVNMATYVGFVTGMGSGGTPAAILGAVTATLGLIAPSIIIILIIAAVLKSFRENHFVEDAFYGLRPASTGLIAAAGLSVAAANLVGAQFGRWNVNWKGLALGVLLWIFTNKVKKTKGLHPILFIAVSAVVGVVLGM